MSVPNPVLRARIARLWRGSVPREKAEAYFQYVQSTGIKDLRLTPGNEGAFAFCRHRGAETEFLILSLWDSLESIRAFAGEDIEQARFYPEDMDFLLSFDRRVEHYEVWSSPTAER